MHSLYENYEKYYRRWEENTEARARGLTPPVFIVVCNNTNVSNLVFRYIGGWDKELPDESTIPVPGQLALFSNVVDGRWLAREIDETAWSALYSTKSRPFDAPTTGKIAVKVINHYGDEVLKVYTL